MLDLIETLIAHACALIFPNPFKSDNTFKIQHFAQQSIGPHKGLPFLKLHGRR
jgi:hypothetical protein